METASLPGSHTKWPNWDLNTRVDTSRIWCLSIILFCPQWMGWVQGSVGQAGRFLAGRFDMGLKVE